MFRRTRNQVRALSTFAGKYPKGKLALTAYRAIRKPVRELYSGIYKVATTAQNTIKWLNGIVSQDTGIPIVDQSMDMLQNDPVFKDVAVNVDSFYTQIEDLGVQEGEINRLIEAGFQGLGVTLSPEEEQQIKADYQVASQRVSASGGQPMLPLAPEPVQPPLAQEPVKQALAQEPIITPLTPVKVSSVPTGRVGDAIGSSNKTKYIKGRLARGGTSKAPVNPLSPGTKNTLDWISNIGRAGSIFNKYGRVATFSGLI